MSQVANELVHSLGNVYGFSSLMLGLTCPQVKIGFRVCLSSLLFGHRQVCCRMR